MSRRFREKLYERVRGRSVDKGVRVYMFPRCWCCTMYSITNANTLQTKIVEASKGPSEN